MKNNSCSKRDPEYRRTFGRRRMAPRACVFESKEHLRTFPGETLEDVGFIACRCSSPGSLGEAIGTHNPDAVVFGLSAGGTHSARAMEYIAAQGFEGKVLLLGPETSPMVSGMRELGDRLGLAMLPVLKTPFADRDLRAAVTELLPAERPPVRTVCMQRWRFSPQRR